MKKYKVSKKFLVEEYSKNKKSIRQIAKIVGCCYDTVRQKLIKNNIHTRKLNETKKEIFKGRNNPAWIDGRSSEIHYCIDCLKKGIKTIINYTAIRCKSCNEKMKHLGKNNPNYKKIGSFHITTEGYKIIKYEDNFWQAEHRYKVEKYLGRKLRKNEIVHHIDGNRKNNNLSNLYIFAKSGLHTSLEILIKYKIISRKVLKSNLKKWRKRR